jgi:hypothetical protein
MEKFNYDVLFKLETLVKISSFNSGEYCHGKDPLLCKKQIIPDLDIKMGRVTKLIRSLGIKDCRIKKVYYKDTRWHIKKIIFMSDESLLTLINLIFRYNLDMKHYSKYDPLQKHPTLKSKAFAYAQIENLNNL